MITAECDEEGRIRLGPELRQRYGRRLFLVEAPGQLVLLPAAEDDVKSLEEWGKPLQHLSLEEIKHIIDKQAMEEVGA